MVETAAYLMHPSGDPKCAWRFVSSKREPRLRAIVDER